MVVVAEAEDAEQARDAVRQHRPDVVLLDLKLGEDDEAGGLSAAA
jgi:DNA-binding NarL/FixJ family response regulator